MGAPAARVHELAREWARLGHEVTVLTAFPHHPTGIKAPADRRVLARRERVDGIDVLRAYVRAAPNRGTARRMLSYASWAAAATVVGALRARRPDVVLATSPQLLTGLTGYFLARRFRVPFVFEVRDLWPESVLAVEAMGENAVVRALKRLAAFLYARADLIVTVGEGYRRQVHELYGVPLERMSVVPNGVDLELFRPGPRDNEVRAAHGWGGRFVVLYMGTLGMAHAVHRALEAARLLRDSHPDIHWAFVGEGAERERLEGLAREGRLDNVSLLPAVPKARVPLHYAACDLGLVTLRAAPLFRHVLPSKIFEYMAMERPLLVAVDGEARRVVEEAGAGRFVPPEDPAALAAAVVELAAQPGEREAMGRRGREAVVSRYDRRALAAEYARLLGAVVAQAIRRSVE